eukprot:1047382-Amphidinium_carterae.1
MKKPRSRTSTKRYKKSWLPVHFNPRPQLRLTSGAWNQNLSYIGALAVRPETGTTRTSVCPSTIELDEAPTRPITGMAWHRDQPRGSWSGQCGPRLTSLPKSHLSWPRSLDHCLCCQEGGKRRGFLPAIVEWRFCAVPMRKTSVSLRRGAFCWGQACMLSRDCGSPVIPQLTTLINLSILTTLTTMCTEALDSVGNNYKLYTTSTTEAACQIYDTCTVDDYVYLWLWTTTTLAQGASMSNAESCNQTRNMTWNNFT